MNHCLSLHQLEKSSESTEAGSRYLGRGELHKVGIRRASGFTDELFPYSSPVRTATSFRSLPHGFSSKSQGRRKSTCRFPSALGSITPKQHHFLFKNLSTGACFRLLSRCGLNKDFFFFHLFLLPPDFYSSLVKCYKAINQI